LDLAIVSDNFYLVGHLHHKLKSNHDLQIIEQQNIVQNLLIPFLKVPIIFTDHPFHFLYEQFILLVELCYITDHIIKFESRLDQRMIRKTVRYLKIINHVVIVRMTKFIFIDLEYLDRLLLIEHLFINLFNIVANTMHQIPSLIISHKKIDHLHVIAFQLT